ncbi:MAG: LacI family DNA-binding transcriptional regulator [Capsulimonadaceae bacterium]
MTKGLSGVSSRATLKDVAQRVGVSINAVSMVLNKTRSTGSISEGMQQKILEAARELGYRPNSAARVLLHGRCNIIGLYFDEVLDMESPYMPALIEGAEQGCRERKQSLLIHSRGNDDTVDDVATKLLSGIVDGLLVAGWVQEDLLERFRDSGMPVVNYHYSRPEFASIVTDEACAARQAVEYLAGNGHRRIYYRTLPDMEPSRGRAFQTAAEDLGLAFQRFDTADINGYIAEGERRILSLVPRDQRPTAALCWNDTVAYRLIDWCTDTGLRVPEDIAVIGFDGSRVFPDRRQRLTTVYMPWPEIGRTGVSLLVDMCDGKEVPKDTLIPSHLVLGDTA